MKARFLALWTVAVLAAAACFVAHLALRFETVRLGYEVGKLRKAQRELLESRRLLSLEAAMLRQPDRVETVARVALGMDMAEPERIVSLKSTSRVATAGRVK